MRIQTRFNPLWVAGILAAIMLGTAFTAQATSYTVNLVAGNNYWTNAATFTPNGVPGIGDDVVFGAMPWFATMNLFMDGGQEANSLTLTNAADANNHEFYISTNRINIVKCYRQNKGGNDHSIRLSDQSVLRLTEFHDLGLYRSRIPVPNSDAEWRFEGAARITYHSEYADASAGGGAWACVLNFTNASSVYLARNANSISNNCEFICTRATGNDYRNLGTVRIGRGDNAAQIWTVGASSHPVLYVQPSQQSTALAKCGSGAVTMPDVDLFLRANLDGGISSNGFGNHGGGTAGGIIAANSLAIDATASTGTRSIGIVEHLLLDGQAGLDGGGAGNGRAFSAITSNQNLKVQINNYGALGTLNVGQIEIAPSGGEVYLNSLGAGTVHLNIGNNNSTTHTYTNSVAVTANTLDLASTNSYLSDRCLYSDTDALASGNIEFRGDFISRSTLTNLWRTDSSTFRAIGGGTNTVQYWECMSKDNGAVSPSTNNFGLAKLIVGKTATGSTTNTILTLRDQYDNNTGDSGAAEAVYVTTLEIYAGSQLHLNGLKLYYKNSGTWQMAVESQTPFPYGDGTGYLGTPPPLGTVIMVK